jgi:hypothetical protein
VPDKPALGACNMLHEQQQRAFEGKPVQATNPDTVDLANPLWLLHVELHNEEDDYHVFTDEFSAWQYLATSVVNEMVDEHDYPDVQALLDAGTTECNVEAAKLFFNQCDGSKYSFSICRIDGPLTPSNLPADDDTACGCKGGWDVFNEGDRGYPLGMIQACGECGHNDDDVAMAKAILAGYRVNNYDGYYGVITRPEDDKPLVANCKFCDEPHLISEMITVTQPNETFPGHYCPACFGGVRSAVNGR